MKRQMRRNNAGFTLVDSAIVIIIIGLLMIGVARANAIVGKAKVRQLARDLESVALAAYTYRGQYGALPGDDAKVTSRFADAAAAATPTGQQGNGTIDGGWNSTFPTDESFLLWQHLRLAQIAPGSSQFSADDGFASYLPRNSEGGRIGVQGAKYPPIAGMTGNFFVCSERIAGEAAAELDRLMDDANPAAGSLRAVAQADMPVPFIVGTSVPPAAVAPVDPAGFYTVCLAF